MKINTTIYGVPSHLCHTTYTPTEYNRPQSLKNVNYLSSPQARKDLNHQLVVRQMPKDSPKANQLMSSNYVKQVKKNGHLVSQYYGENNGKQAEGLFFRKRLEEIERRVNQNTQDILWFKEKQMNSPSKILLQQSPSKSSKAQITFQNQFAQKLKNFQVQLKQIKLTLSLRDDNLHQKSLKQNDTREVVQTDEKSLIKIKALIQERIKQETLKIKLIIENQNNKLSSVLKQEITKSNLSITPIKSKLRYPFTSIKLHYKQFLKYACSQQSDRQSTKQSNDSPRDSKYSNYSNEPKNKDANINNANIFGKLLNMQQQMYFIDKDGYLLDENNYYLIDQNNNMIRLNKNMIIMLKNQGILKIEA